MKRGKVEVELSFPSEMTLKEAMEALREMIQLGRSKLAGATKDEVAIKYLKVEAKIKA